MKERKIRVADLISAGERVRLAEFPDDELGTWLELVIQPDGRIDLVDQACPDTGSDISAYTLDELDAAVSEWLSCVSDGPEDRDAGWGFYQSVRKWWLS